MPDLAPYPAVRYAGSTGDVGRLLAPPYDVIAPDEARALRDASPHNAVRLVLPEGDAPGRYDLAAGRLRDWLDEGVLVRDEGPALYVYAQSFEHDGRRRTRRGVFGALRLSPFGEGEVLPHEETHRGPKRDRLALMRACRAQLSPVFLLAPDPDRRLPSLLDRAARRTPVLEAETPDGLEHRLWRVEDGDLADGLREAAGAGPLLIADGHHRYETALEMARGRPGGDPARRTLACVVGRGDPGLLCLPTHRALRRAPGAGEGGAAAGSGRDGAEGPDATPGRGRDPWRALLEEGFDVEPLDTGGPEEAARAAAGAGGGAVAVLPGRGGAFLLRPAADGDGGEAPDAGSSPLAFDRRVLRAGYGAGPDAAVEQGVLSYHRDAAAAVGAAGELGAAFLLPPPDVDAIWARARRGERMPPKSTYFWPKLPSGLLFRLLE